MVRSASGSVHVQYHGLFLTSQTIGWFDELERMTYTQFLEVVGGTLRIETGIHTGWLGVEVEFLDGPPDNVGEWEDTGETVLTVNTGELSLAVMMDDVAPQFRQFVVDNGVYRVRVSAVGRGVDPDGVGMSQSDPFERYLIQVWPGSQVVGAA